jgi:hypothetical protein
MYQYSIETETKVTNGQDYVIHRDEFPAMLTLSAVMAGILTYKRDAIVSINIRVKERWCHDI